MIKFLQQYSDCFRIGDFDALYDYIAPNFYFKNPRFEIFGRDAYIDYNKEHYHGCATETIVYEKISQNTYKHQYMLELVNSEDASLDRILIEETMTIEANMIVSSVLEYDLSCISKSAKEKLKFIDEIYGEFSQKTG